MSLTMYDAVNLAEIPAAAEAVAGYVNGAWPTYPQVVKQWPNAHHLSIAVSAEADADCLDIEQFDAFPAQAPDWYRRQRKRGVTRPVLYTSLSNAQQVIGIMDASGIPRAQFRLWTAHYTGVPHRCSSKCGYGLTTTADGTQYTDKAKNANLDASLLADGFFVTAADRRHALRAWILLQRARGMTWAALKKTAKWVEWRRLGGH